MIKLTLIFFPTSHAKDFLFAKKIYIHPSTEGAAKAKKKVSSRPRPNPPPLTNHQKTPKTTTQTTFQAILSSERRPMAHRSLAAVTPAKASPRNTHLAPKRRSRSLGSALVCGILMSGTCHVNLKPSLKSTAHQPEGDSTQKDKGSAQT